MAQQNNTFIYNALDASTAPWTLVTWLTNVVFNLYKINRNSSWVIASSTQVVTDGVMIELWGWAYGYTYLWYSIWQEYHYSMNPNSALCYIETGVTTNIDQWISEIRWWIGWFSVNYQAINSHTTSKVNELKKEHEKTRELITKENNETSSHIDIAKNEVIATIDTIEIPKSDMSEITLWIGVLKQRFTKLSEFLRKEADMEKEGMKKELESKIEEIEQAYEDMQKLHSEEIESKTSELSEKEKLIAEMEETAQELMEVLEEEWKVNKVEVEKEVKEKIISSLSE